MSVSVITPALPDRLGMLAECMASVRAQTLLPLEHLIAIDYERIGVIENTNRLVASARGDWILPIADDDLLLPHCIETLLNAPGEGRIIYSEPRVEGESWGLVGWGPMQGSPSGLPSTALIQRSLWNELGGYRDAGKPEDFDFWTRATEAHAGFRYVPEQTWVYRLNHEGGNLSRGTLK